MKILGVNKGETLLGKQLRHGGCAAFVDGRFIAIAEERVTGRKYAGGFTCSLARVVAASGLASPNDFDVVAVSSCCESEKDAVDGHAIAGRGNALAVGHHLSHASLAFYGSGFDRALVAVIDSGGNTMPDPNQAGNGEWWTCPREQSSYYVGDVHGGLELVDRDFNEPNQTGLGELYRAFTYYLGWHSSTHSSKTMALAGHGDRGSIPGCAFQLEHGRLQCAVQNNPTRPIQMVADLSHELGVDFGEPRPPRGAILDIHRQVAAFIQRSIEDALMAKLTLLRNRHRATKLCIGGGVALNVVANARLADLFHEGVYVPSAPGDDGQSLGNVYAALRMLMPKNKVTVSMATSTKAFLGPAEQIDSAAVANALDATGHSSYVVFETSDPSELLARLLASGQLVCVYQQRAEFGPRALGARSILADPRRSTSVAQLNTIKRREWFMPFAPTVLKERMHEWFRPTVHSPFMSFAVRATPQALEKLHAVVNADGTARVQTVGPDDKESFLRNILLAFEKQTDIPVVLNTSFNLGGDPIVEGMGAALSSFGEMPINALALGRFVVVKSLSPTLADLPLEASVRKLRMTVHRSGEVVPVDPGRSKVWLTVRNLQSLTKAVVFVRSELPLYGPYLEWLREGRKVTTIRFRKGAVEIPHSPVLPLFVTTDYSPGDRTRPTEHVQISAIRYQKFGELSDSDAERDGFENLAHLRHDLTKIYADLSDDDWVTVYDIGLVDR